jgi:hypothetical protein
MEGESESENGGAGLKSNQALGEAAVLELFKSRVGGWVEEWARWGAWKEAQCTNTVG